MFAWIIILTLYLAVPITLASQNGACPGEDSRADRRIPPRLRVS